ncbi:MAG: MogA/MoaB family molybdenum cofactor biosynthesis protein [Phycisphaerales bacterium]|nr:MogA/MoaB family molybdenum cofactor biosynthesis protein [Phycisphaerales bacterium]
MNASVVVLTISDSRSAGKAEDRSGPIAAEQLAALGLPCDERRIVPDDIDAIRKTVSEAAKSATLIVTTGGTGVGPRDVTPEALRPIFDRELPGFGEIMRTGSYSMTPLSIISRGGAGVIGDCLVVMLPGSPNGVRDGLSLVGPAIKHVLKVLSDLPSDCERASRSNDPT